jgi:hypothetical protein
VTCTSCGADLDERDRFCPACGSPNHGARRQARFGPSLEPPDPYEELPEEVAADEVRCPRCGRAVKRTSEFCWWCGLDMDEVLLRASRSDTVGVWYQPGPQGTTGYRPLTARASGLRVVLWLLSLVALVALALVAARFAANESGEALGVARADLARWGDAVMVGLGVGGLAVAVALVAFVHRASANLPGLAVTDARYSPATAVWCWVVPVVNFVLPYAVVEDLWRASGADGPPLTRARLQERPSLVVYLWWPFVLLGAILLAVAGAATPASPAIEQTTWRVVFLLSSIGAVTLAVGCTALAFVIGEIAHRQARRADRLGPPAWLTRHGRGPSPEPEAEPQPTTPELRDVDQDRNWGRF